MDVPEVNLPFVAKSASQWRRAAACGRLASEAETADNARAHALRYIASAAARAPPRALRLDLAAAQFDLAPAPPPSEGQPAPANGHGGAAKNRGVRLEHFRQRRRSRLQVEPLEALPPYIIVVASATSVGIHSKFNITKHQVGASQTMSGLKIHCHRERVQVVETLVPLIKRHIGRDLIALAITGSVARNTDRSFSDIELIGIVRRPIGGRAYVKFIYDGLLVDIWCLTKREYIAEHREKVRPSWPYAASNVLVPLFNEKLINEISNIPYNYSEADRFDRIEQEWMVFQERVSKVLNAAHDKNENSLPYLFWQMVEKMCALLSILNGRPFITRATAFEEVRDFEKLPEKFHDLVRPEAAQGAAADVAGVTRALFDSMERLLQENGLRLYPSTLDEFVAPATARTRLAEALKLRSMARKANGFIKHVHKLGHSRPVSQS
jgi:hypothetical protein